MYKNFQTDAVGSMLQCYKQVVKSNHFNVEFFRISFQFYSQTKYC
jgi:hypothetical protein